jgi:transcriptional regulator with XRE-family HTH domain
LTFPLLFIIIKINDERRTDMRWYELAEKLGWSQAYLSKVMHGYIRPSYTMTQRARKVTKKQMQWWEDASQAEVQALLNKLREA